MANSCDAGEITNLLLAWGDGNEGALTTLIPLVYDELRRIARRQMARECGQTLQPSALVNETFVRLVDCRAVQWQNRAQFFALTAGLMRRILVDSARNRSRHKRGGGWHRVTFDDAIGSVAIDTHLLAIDEALEALAKIDARKARVVELRFFAGLTEEEIGEALKISTDTVARDWKFARAWLLHAMKCDPSSRPHSRK